MKRTRKQRGIVLVAAVTAAVITANLGLWQLRRADQKLALQAGLIQRKEMPGLDAMSLATTSGDAEVQHYRRVKLRGSWLDDHTVWLDNRQMNGHPGFYVLTPLRLAGSERTVVVQRGWAPRNALERTQLPRIETVRGEVEVDGYIAPPPGRLYEFATSSSGVIRQNLDYPEYAHETGLTLAPLSVVQEQRVSDKPDGLLRDWPLPAVNVHKHYGYAAQWFALSALISGLYVWFQLIRPRLGRRA